jgi:hypothetical protein
MQDLQPQQEITRKRSRHPYINPTTITGIAFDSLFRQLCAEQALATPEGRQIRAPFAFGADSEGSRPSVPR